MEQEVSMGHTVVPLFKRLHHIVCNAEDGVRSTLHALTTSPALPPVMQDRLEADAWSLHKSMQLSTRLPT